MSIEIVILQIVAISCIAILLRSRKNLGWSLVAAGILLVMAIGWFSKALWTPWLVAGLWGMGIGFPILCMSRITKLVAQEKFYQARRIAQVIRILHPGDGWWNYPTILKAQALGQSGNLQSALNTLEPLQNRETYDGRLAIALAYGLQAKWYPYLNFAETELTTPQRSQENSSAAMYLRSLGETRQLNELMSGVRDCHLQSSQSGNIALVLLSKLYAFAFTGQVDNVQLLLKTNLNDYSAANKRFWTTTAQWCAGNAELAVPAFQELRKSSSCGLQSALDWRSKQAPIRGYELLNLESRTILSRLQQTQQEDLKYNPRNPTKLRQVPLTYGIIVVNCLVYILPFTLMLYSWFFFNRETSSISVATTKLMSDIINIYDWGALVPDQLFDGAWWQPLTAIFLHDPSSVIHLLFNMLGLMVVGAFVESRLGTLKFAIAYFVSGIGSMALLAVLARLAGSGTMSAIGASGAIMGMVGVMGAIYWKGWKKGDRVAKQWLRSIALIVGLQTLFDSLNPNVSMTGHLAGLFLGAAVGLVLSPKD
jgi:rhomboid protease GluP